MRSVDRSRARWLRAGTRWCTRDRDRPGDRRRRTLRARASSPDRVRAGAARAVALRARRVDRHGWRRGVVCFPTRHAEVQACVPHRSRARPPVRRPRRRAPGWPAARCRSASRRHRHDEDEPDPARSTPTSASRGSSPACSTSTSPARSRRTGCTSRPTRRASRRARSAATSPTTPAARTASPYGVTSVARARRRGRAARRRGRRARRPRRRAGRARPAGRVRRQRGHARHRHARSPCASRRTRRRCARCCSTSSSSTPRPRRVRAIIAAGIVPAALEMMDGRHHARRRGLRARRATPPTRPRCCSSRSTGLPAGVDAAADAGRPRSAGATAPAPCAVAADDAERALLWKGRKTAFGAIARIAPELLPARHGRAPHASSSRCSRRSTRSPPSTTCVVMNVFHAGDGNLHPLLVFDAREPGVLERVHAAGDEIVARVAGRRRRAVGRARHRPREARPHGLAVHRRRPRRPGPACATRSTPTACANPGKVLPAGARLRRPPIASPRACGCDGDRRCAAFAAEVGADGAGRWPSVGGRTQFGVGGAGRLRALGRCARRSGIVEHRARGDDGAGARRHDGRRARRRARRSRPVRRPARRGAGADGRRRARRRAQRAAPTRVGTGARRAARGPLRRRPTAGSSRPAARR